MYSGMEHLQGLLDNDFDVSLVKEFSQTIDEIGSWHQALGQQLSESVAAPIHRYIDKELQELFTVGKLYESTTEELDQALTRYARCSSRSRSDVDTERADSAHGAYVSRKKFHQIALLYFNKMNLLQHSRKVALLDPLLGFVQACRSFHSMGNGTLNAADTESFLCTASQASQAVQTEIARQMTSSADHMDAIISQSEKLYPVSAGTTVVGGDLRSADHVTSAGHSDSSSYTIAGYLFHKSRYMGVMSQWERSYFYVDGDCNLMMTRRGQLAASLCLELDSSTLVQPLPAEDRHAVFQISTDKKSLILQALNEEDRDAWSVAIGHIVSNRRRMQSKASEAADKDTGGISHTQAAYMAAGSILSGVSQFFVGRRQHRVQTQRSMGSSHCQRQRLKSGSSLDASDIDMPIVFDLGWRDAALNDDAGASWERPSSPFDPERSPTNSDEHSQKSKRPPFVGQQFEASFLGSLEVPTDRGHQMVAMAINRVLETRQNHQLPTAQAVILEPSLQALLVHEQSTSGASDGARRRTVSLPFSRLSFWASHLDSERMMGVISASDHGALLCHVFETRVVSQQVCSALTQATAAAFRRQRDAQLLLQNIHLQPDVEVDAELHVGNLAIKDERTQEQNVPVESDA